MTKTLRFLSALLLPVALVGLSACGGGIPGDAVVQVGGKSITKTTFSHWMQVASASTAASGGKPVVPDPPTYSACIAHLKATAPKPTKPKKAPKPPSEAQLKTQCEQQYKSLQQQVLGFLISSDWVIGEAQSLGVKLTDAEVKQQFLKIKNQQFPKPAEFEKFLAGSGQTVSDLLLRIKAVSLLPQKIEAKIVRDKGKVTESQISQYYEKNKSRFGTPEKRTVRIILTKTEAAANSAKAEVESGKSFASVAKGKSIDPTSRANGGLLPEVIKGEEQKALDTAIFSAATNKLSGPIKTPFGLYVFEVKHVTPPHQQPLSHVKSSIKQQLMATQQRTALTEFVKAFKKKWTAKTDCRAGYIVMDCRTFKPLKTPAPNTGAAVPQTTPPAQTTTVPTTTR